MWVIACLIPPQAIFNVTVLIFSNHVKLSIDIDKLFNYRIAEFEVIGKW
jgi:hypothetical protein